EDADHVDAVGRLEVFRRERLQVLEVGKAGGHAGAVDQHVGAAPVFAYGGGQREALRVVGDVGLHHDRAGAEVAALLRHAFGRLRALRVVHHHVVAALGEPQGSGGTDAGGRAGDDADRAFLLCSGHGEVTPSWAVRQ